MKIGVCIGTDVSKPSKVKKAGFDYVETSFNSLASLDENGFIQFYNSCAETGIPCEAANCFLPGGLKITGKSVDCDALKSFIEKGFIRSKQIGIETVVFGSSGARGLNDGISVSECYIQILDFLKNTAARLCDKYDINLCIEPLRAEESVVINTVKEACVLAALSLCGHIGVTADIYHMRVSGERYANIADSGSLVKHAHISYPFPLCGNGRVFPDKKYGFDYSGFVSALKNAGCPRLSIEASTHDFDKDIVSSYEVLKEFR